MPQVSLTEDQKEITAMVSGDGERVDLTTPVQIVGEIEDWLNVLCNTMMSSLNDQLKVSLGHQDFKAHCSQVLCLREGIQFTKSTAAAISHNSLHDLKDQLRSQLIEYTQSNWSGYRVMQLKVQCLIMDTIHYLDVVNQLIDKRVESEDDWIWNKQLKYLTQVTQILLFRKGDHSDLCQEDQIDRILFAW